MKSNKAAMVSKKAQVKFSNMLLDYANGVSRAAILAANCDGRKTIKDSDL
tara:strand:+ start:3824 stop:3973 length:150 start_codon:yes stop_codon:yes gene_type:complete